MTERKITDRIIKELRSLGFFVFKVHGSAYQQAGLPDLFAIKDGRLLAIEVKRPGGQTTNLQARTLQRLEEAGAIVSVVNSWEELSETIRTNQ